MGEWIAYWYPMHETGLAPKTRAQYRSTINRWILPELGSRRIASVSRLDLQDLVNRWAKEAKPTTIHHRFSVLRAALMAAVNGDVLLRSPCRGVKLPKRQHQRRVLLLPDQLSALVEATPPDHRAMVWLGAVLGMRWGEVAGLRVQSVDLLRQELHVTETVGEAAGVLHFGPPKSVAGRRLLPIPPPVVEVLAEHLRAMRLTGADAEAHLFLAPRGGPLRYSKWHRFIWIPARETIGRPDLGFQDLRRLYASNLVVAGVDVKVSQELMGHEDIRLTRGLYAQAGDDSKRQANDAVADHLMNPTMKPDAERKKEA